MKITFMKTLKTHRLQRMTVHRLRKQKDGTRKPRPFRQTQNRLRQLASFLLIPARILILILLPLIKREKGTEFLNCETS
ncbi:MAG: hypothetical protein IJX80_09240 [Clostridia bacterium]|nr:hypothetical protein [Clostridia bacterium]